MPHQNKHKSDLSQIDWSSETGPRGFLRWTAINSAVLSLTLALSLSVLADDNFVPPEVVTILEALPVSKFQKTPQQSPIDNHEGSVYIANIEAGPSGDTDGIDLHTTIRKGVEEDTGKWSWTEHVVENRTIADAWHTVPSVAVDKGGYIHVAYNMHNLPWQYSVSTEPEDINTFEFLGEELTTKDISIFKNDNRTNFPSLGKAAIAGNQVTYPAFFKDNNQDLYITYRYAAKPARKFKDRAMSSAIAKYDTEAKVWENIGVAPELTKGDYKKSWTEFFDDPIIPKAFAMQADWTSYHPRLMFGPDNEMGVSWMWREGIAGSEISRPCYLQSKDKIEFRNSSNAVVELPAKSTDCSNILGVSDTEKFNSIGNSAVDSKGRPHLILSPIRGSRKLVSFINNQWLWEDSPYGATEVFFDKHDNLWALASGLSILVRRSGEKQWLKVLIADEKRECRPRASLNIDKSRVYIYSPSCRENTVSVKMIDLTPDLKPLE